MSEPRRMEVRYATQRLIVQCKNLNQRTRILPLKNQNLTTKVRGQILPEIIMRRAIAYSFLLMRSPHHSASIRHSTGERCSLRPQQRVARCGSLFAPALGLLWSSLSTRGITRKLKTKRLFNSAQNYLFTNTQVAYSTQTFV